MSCTGGVGQVFLSGWTDNVRSARSSSQQHRQRHYFGASAPHDVARRRPVAAGAQSSARPGGIPACGVFTGSVSRVVRLSRHAGRLSAASVHPASRAALDLRQLVALAPGPRRFGGVRAVAGIFTASCASAMARFTTASTAPAGALRQVWSQLQQVAPRPTKLLRRAEHLRLGPAEAVNVCGSPTMKTLGASPRRRNRQPRVQRPPLQRLVSWNSSISRCAALRGVQPFLHPAGAPGRPA